MKQLVGISFSSRNRPDTLEICLSHIFRFLSPGKFDYVIVVVNDLGATALDSQYETLMEKFPTIIMHRSTTRLGIAKTKNIGIRMLKEKNCDHFFFFDDDIFPIKCGWEELYIETSVTNNIHHLMHQFPLPVGYEIIRNENGICEYSLCCGVLLYFTKYAIEKLGGYRKDFGIYGYEHVELTLRCNSAGLQPDWGPYISPERTREYIYSLDLDLNNWGIQPPGMIITSEMWRSSIAGEDVQVHVDYNANFFLQKEPVFEEI